MMRMAWCHLWTVAAGTGSQSATSTLRRGQSYVAVSRPMSATTTSAPDSVPALVREDRALQRRKSDRVRSAAGGEPRRRSGETVDPGRMSTARTGTPFGNGREVVGPIEARAGSIDDDRLDRQRGDVDEHHASHARHDSSRVARRRAVGPLPLPATTATRRPCPAQKVDGGAVPPLRQHVRRAQRLARARQRRSPPSRRGDDRDHSGSVATTACASVSVWVRLISNRPAPCLGEHSRLAAQHEFGMTVVMANDFNLTEANGAEARLSAT